MTEHRMTSWDGKKLFYRAWFPEKPAKKAVILFHGGHEHSGRFQDLVDRLDLKETCIYAWDARGHGLSPGQRGFANHFQDFVRDADAFIMHISRITGISTNDMVLMGHSVGSVIISTWLLDYARTVRGAIISSPAFKVKLYVPFALPLLRLLQRIKPDAFVNSYVKPAFLTHDKQEAHSRLRDKLISPKIAVRVLTSLFDTTRRVIRSAGNIKSPMLIFSAGSDWVVRQDAHREFYDRLGSRDKALQLYPGYFHEILHEENRAIPISQARRFIETLFAGEQFSTQAQDYNINTEEQKRLTESLSALNPKYWYFLSIKLAMNTLGRLSEGIRGALITGFDAGQALDYVYENKASGRLIIGRLIDRLYLDSLGWRLIRQRGVNLQSSIEDVVGKYRAQGKPVHILDIAAGHGRYLLKCLAKINDQGISAECRDLESRELARGRRLADELGLQTVRFNRGDAFDPPSLANLTTKPDIVIVSGLYELFSDNQLLQQSLASIHEVMNDDGHLIYTNQPSHPQLELIARTLLNREKKPWIMRLRSQAEMNKLVNEAGFDQEEMQIDDHGVFSITIAKKRPSQSAMLPRKISASAAF
jgi:alpha-beta hydrolase superfamily lysophospholipase/ubiquinone/menaquinone biosynthesis C-methylase UbiE